MTWKWQPSLHLIFCLFGHMATSSGKEGGKTVCGCPHPSLCFWRAHIHVFSKSHLVFASSTNTYTTFSIESRDRDRSYIFVTYKQKIKLSGSAHVPLISHAGVGIGQLQQNLPFRKEIMGNTAALGPCQWLCCSGMSETPFPPRGLVPTGRLWACHLQFPLSAYVL